jgi:hypothetical protein
MTWTAANGINFSLRSAGTLTISYIQNQCLPTTKLYNCMKEPTRQNLVMQPSPHIFFGCSVDCTLFFIPNIPIFFRCGDGGLYTYGYQSWGDRGNPTAPCHLSSDAHVPLPQQQNNQCSPHQLKKGCPAPLSRRKGRQRPS